MSAYQQAVQVPQQTQVDAVVESKISEDGPAGGRGSRSMFISVNPWIHCHAAVLRCHTRQDAQRCGKYTPSSYVDADVASISPNRNAP